MKATSMTEFMISLNEDELFVLTKILENTSKSAISFSALGKRGELIFYEMKEELSKLYKGDM